MSEGVRTLSFPLLEGVCVAAFVVVGVTEGVGAFVLAGVTVEEPLLWRTTFSIVTLSPCGQNTIALTVEPTSEGIV